MLQLDADLATAKHQLDSLLFFLVVFGYVDGDFDESERDFIRSHVRDLLRNRAQRLVPHLDARVREAAVDKEAVRYDRLLERFEDRVVELWTEPTGEGESPEEFVLARLKVRCFEIFQGFSVRDRRAILDSVEELLMADGHAHAAEMRFRDEIATLVEGGEISSGLDLADDGPPPPVRVTPVPGPASDGPIPTFVRRLEVPYAASNGALEAQLEEDGRRIERALTILDRKRSRGEGALQGVRAASQLAGRGEVLDGWVHAVPLDPSREYELTVLGDLHGCYGCFKAALVQSRFFERVEAHRRDPASVAEPRLVLLGDYIDRGRFGLDGVVRTALELLIQYPDYVYMLRGNHEWYVRRGDKVLPAVSPAETYMSLFRRASPEAMQRFARLFDALPTALVFGEVLFVHAGIPPERHINAVWKDLSSLNEPTVRLRMLWGDPSQADVIPTPLQEQRTARFSFGRLQAQSFLRRVGCHTLIRGHEVVADGFREEYGEGPIRLYTLFSCGGADNVDLPVTSRYRRVQPKALTVRARLGEYRLEPWPIDWQRFNNPADNGFLSED